MSVYNRRARRTREDDLALIISDDPKTVTRTRKTHADPMRGATEATAGPFTVRIEQFRATRNATVFDEKGSTATAAYVLVGLHRPALKWNLPRLVTEGGKQVPVFRLNDLITDGDGNVYRITSPARWDGNAVELNLELQG